MAIYGWPRNVKCLSRRRVRSVLVDGDKRGNLNGSDVSWHRVSDTFCRPTCLGHGRQCTFDSPQRALDANAEDLTLVRKKATIPAALK